MLHFHLKSFLLFLLILLIEIGIALWVHNKIIRPYGGDALVVIMIYFFIKAFFIIKPMINIVGVTVFAFLVEFAQYGNLVQYLGLQDNRFWVIVIGNSFHWLDLLAYLTGALMLYFIEVKRIFSLSKL